MLTELRITNFAIIDHLEIRFDSGLTVFTGETGAGKSIIIDALETVLGSRANTSLIRSGAERASIEADFYIPEAVRSPIHDLLKNEDLLDDPDYITLGRDLRRSGRNVARVNGRSVSLNLLRALGEYLVDIHGQSQHLSLLRVREHIKLLDAYANSDNLLAAYRKVYHTLQETHRELEALRAAERDSAQRADLLRFQVDEIEAANLHPGEEDDLRAERIRLSNAEKLAMLAQKALQFLDEGSPESPAATDLLGGALDALNRLTRIDAEQSKLSEQATALFEETADLSRALQNYLDSTAFDPNRLAEIEERLDLIVTLKRKYGNTIADVLATAERARTDLDNITHAEERLQELEGQASELLKQLAARGLSLSAQRQTAADALSRAIEAELNDLRMPGARFRVDFSRKPDPQGVLLPDGEQVAFNAEGIEQVEFLVETNPGEGFKPLVKIASGGETARLMLALKNVLAQADRVPTLIFDEIDQGIGGRVGAVVGQKLWQLARQHQVLCVTHLPQLAAFSGYHFQVQKQIEGGRTTTTVTQVEGDARIHELAQMLGAVSIGTLKSAQEILQSAGEWTAGISDQG